MPLTPSRIRNYFKSSYSTKKCEYRIANMPHRFEQQCTHDQSLFLGGKTLSEHSWYYKIAKGQKHKNAARNQNWFSVQLIQQERGSSGK